MSIISLFGSLKEPEEPEKKQEEEQKIADAVSYFVADNPITTGGHAAAPASTPKPD